MIIYAGSYGNGLKPSTNKGSLSANGKGIYALNIREDNTVEILDTANGENMSQIVQHPSKPIVYAIHETKDEGGLNGAGGGISSYHCDNGKLTFLNHSPSYGSRPAYLTISTDKKYLLVANHGSHTTVTCHYEIIDGKPILQRGFDDSSIAVFKLNEDGTIGSLTDLKVKRGNGYWCYGGGQSTSHLHCVKERNHLVIAANRGADALELFHLTEDGKLIDICRVQTHPAFAPRHICFHPEKEIVYVLNENYPCLSVYAIKENTLNEIEWLPTMDTSYCKEHPIPLYEKRHADPDEQNTSGMADRTLVMPSDIHVTEDGHYLYASNRCYAENGSITCYKIQNDGTLILLENKELNGKDPRGFQIIENRLIVGLMDQDTVSIYQIEKDGKLTHLKTTENMPGITSFTNKPSTDF